MRRGYTKVEFDSHELSDKAWIVYSQTDDAGCEWLKKRVFDDNDNEHYEYYQWYMNDIYERIGTIEDVNSYLESEYDEYPDAYI